MSRYKEYKDSGIEWIGEIPTTWKLLRFKSDFSYVKGKNPTETYYADEANGRDTSMPYLSMEYLRNENIEGEFPLLEEKLVSVDNNETLLLWDGSNAGEFIKSKKGFLSSTMVRIDHSSKINGKYSFYIFLCYERILRDFTNGMGIPHVNGVLLNNSYLPITVDEAEQFSIAEYLDDQTQKIDQLITNKKVQAEKLKELRRIEINNVLTKGLNPKAEMKDSGIDWLGVMPKHWKSIRLKHISSVRGRIGFRGYTTEDLVDETEGAITIGATHITSNGLINLTAPIYISWDKYYESPEIMVELGDLIIVQRGSTVGKVGVVISDIGKATINPSVVLIRPNKRIDTQYLFFYILSDLISKTVSLLTSSTAIPMISQEQIENFEILLPPISEQQKIVEHLKAKTVTIDKLIKNIDVQIENLKELRKIKISEAVTGKIKVNSYVETTA